MPALLHEIKSSVFTLKLLDESLGNRQISHKCFCHDALIDGSSETNAFSQGKPPSVIKQHLYILIWILICLSTALVALIKSCCIIWLQRSNSFLVNEMSLSFHSCSTVACESGVSGDPGNSWQLNGKCFLWWKPMEKHNLCC